MPDTTYQIAIDGPAASGKSTAARLVADRLGGYYINTGDMYRTLTWVALERGIDIEGDPDAVTAMCNDLDLRYGIDAETEKPQLYLNNDPVPQASIRDPGVAKFVSQVARIPGVRAWLVERQRETQSLGTIVMEGRDIGTVILPNASHKFFLTASPEVRARRRLAQDGEVPPDATVASVAAQIAERDRIDSTRAVAPLKAAEDAALVNSDDLTIDQVVDTIVAHMRTGESQTSE